MRNNKPIKVKNRVKHSLRFIRKNTVLDTIVNTPLHPVTGIPIVRREKVYERRLVRKGWHMYWQVIIQDERGNLILREVLA